MSERDNAGVMLALAHGEPGIVSSHRSGHHANGQNGSAAALHACALERRRPSFGVLSRRRCRLRMGVAMM